MRHFLKQHFSLFSISPISEISLRKVNCFYLRIFLTVLSEVISWAALLKRIKKLMTSLMGPIVNTWRLQGYNWITATPLPSRQPTNRRRVVWWKYSRRGTDTPSMCWRTNSNVGLDMTTLWLRWSTTNVNCESSSTAKWSGAFNCPASEPHWLP